MFTCNIQIVKGKSYVSIYTVVLPSHILIRTSRYGEFKFLGNSLQYGLLRWPGGRTLKFSDFFIIIWNIEEKLYFSIFNKLLSFPYQIGRLEYGEFKFPKDGLPYEPLTCSQGQNLQQASFFVIFSHFMAMKSQVWGIQ